ncbi:patatin-like phospholipase family protein [Oikeobacillus pervagus]|nr:patatin-like phospholipase family protein [Oikeobacillus pervagus]
MLIDGVFSGGGIKGFALVGAYQEIEEKGYVFSRLAGTSAGSIVAAFIAAGYKSKEIYQLLDELDTMKLLDSTSPIDFALFKWLAVFWKLGLYKGNALETWINEKLALKGVVTFADLPNQTLRVVASDITRGRMLVLPDDLKKYGIHPKHFPVARAIRMSCTIPYFFQPVKLKGQDGVSLIVDGGVLSNFPMWLFDRDGRRTRPVLGIKLSPHYSEYPKYTIHNSFQLFHALFQTMKDAHDARYISRKHEKNIIFIKTNGTSATEFELNDEKKHALVETGRKAAREFLKKWSY